ncbi:MAG: hypothetical protein IJZ86_08870 [Bacteroides sp.]|nr:hypothetical protein [Bacteroides sp.]
MKRIILALFIALIANQFTLAQQAQNDVVYLEKGGVVVGTIIEQVPGVSVKLRTANGNILSYQMQEVKMIVKKQQEQSGTENKTKVNSEDNISGYRGFVEFDYNMAIGTPNEDCIGFTTTHGGECSPHCFVGAGIGLNYYLDSDVFTIPLFANVRAFLLKKEFTPFLDVKVGYSLGDEVKGFYLAPSIGYRIHLFDISVGYTLQKYKSSRGDKLERLSIKVGVNF